MAAPKQTDPQFKLRLTPELKAKLSEAADESGRSLNAEILWRLEQSFAPAHTSQEILDQMRPFLERLLEASHRGNADVSQTLAGRESGVDKAKSGKLTRKE